jgi:syntaxin 16
MEIIKQKTLSTLSSIPLNYFMSTTEDSDQPEFEKIEGVICDKFEKFCEYRKSYQNHFFHYLENDIFKESNSLLENSILNDSDEKRVLLLSQKNIELAELNALKNKNSNFFELFHSTEFIYKELNNDMNLLRRRQQDRIKTKVYESENKQIDKEIEKIIKSMTNKVKLCEINIKQIAAIPDTSLSNIDIKIKDNIKVNLSQKIHDFSYNFRKNEEQFMEKLQKLGSKSSVIDDEDNSIKEFDEKHKNIFLHDDSDSQIKIRNDCLDSLVTSINELSTIFKDLQNIIHEQGTILDRIDYNIEIAEENTKNAYGHLNEANKLQKSSCFRNVTLIIMFVIFIEAILLINKYL